MWKPSERIKYAPTPGFWPNQAEARDSQLFQPITYQALTLRDRTWVPAMVPWRALETGEVTEDNVDWYGRFARGKPGGLVVEATGIRDVPSGPLLRIGHDRFIPGLTRLTDRVRQESQGDTKLFIQLIDFLAVRRRPEPAKFLSRFLAITESHRQALGLEDASEGDVRLALQKLSPMQLSEILTTREIEALNYGQRERVTDTHLPHIADLPKQLPALFAQAARRARTAGFDGIELHFAHAYTVASFLSRTNDRDDSYGGCEEARVKLALEIIDAVRSSVGRDYVVGTRILTEECIPGGSTIDDSLYYAEQFAHQGLDYISLSRGGKFDDAKQPKVGWAVYPYTGPSGYECMPQYLSDEFGPFGRNLSPATVIRKHLHRSGSTVPIIVAGGIHNFDQAERAIDSGAGDIIGFARQALADPDWFEKVRQGRGNEVRLCVYSNYCEGLDQKHKQVTCNLWDRSALNEPCKKTEDGKRRLIAPDWP
jgi:2,4-dienoyl-CoA reductase-like NADH-dependent reductase (Old Yellow Enzyme family)